jgi:hypothetical protein
MIQKNSEETRMSFRQIAIGLMAGAMSAALLPALASADTTGAKKPAAKADAPKATKVADQKPPRSPDGHPDLTGTWTNATLTKLERDPKYGNNIIMPDSDAHKLEKDTDDYTAFRQSPTKSFDVPLDSIPCSPGFVGTNCGYNAGWIDPGNRVMRVDGKPVTSFITFPENGRIPPFKAGARPTGALREARGEGDDGPPPALPSVAAAAAAAANNPASAAVRAAAADGAARTAARGAAGRGPQNPENLSLGERCIMSFGQSSGPIMQPQLYNNDYQFVQTKDSIGIWVEMVHDVKIVHLNTPHRTDGVRPYMGDSIGHWDGDTLVVETTNFPKAQALRGSWENLKVTEKFTRLSPTRLRYQFTVEDPTLWDKPWGGEYEFTPAKGQVYEYACHEGNYAMEGILAGARDEEKQTADAAKARAEAIPASAAR